MDIDWSNLSELLKFLIGGGSSLVVMSALSFLAENWCGWHTLPRWLNFVLPMLLSALIAGGAQVPSGYADAIKEIATWYSIVVVAIMSWIQSQKTYAATKSAGYGVHNL